MASFRDGAWLCEFASVTDPGAVWETLAASLRVQPFPGRSLEESVLEYLAAKRLLLVLDNCEHLLDAVAHQVDAITRRCARVSVLATSREGLALGGERMVAVPSLGVPTGDGTDDEFLRAESVRLFGDRASAARSDFELTGRNASAVGVLCRRLDGIPLAIELAAARVRSMSPEDLVARLDQRFKLLTRGSRAALERHQTLRSTIDWSYDLLDPVERQALDRLSVFAGGCDLAAAEAVLAGDDLDVFDVDDVLGQLVDKSLVVADNDDSGGVRYRLLETHPPIRRRNDCKRAATPRWFDGATPTITWGCRKPQARTSGAEITSSGLGVVVRDTDNFRAALDWAVETPSPEHALRLVAPLALQGRTGELAMDWAATASAIPGGDDHPLFPVVASWAAWGATTAGDFERAEDLVAVAERAQAMLGTRLPSVAHRRATLTFFQGNVEQARHHAQEWVGLARASGDAYELAHALVMLGTALRSTEETLDAATATLDEAVRVARAAGIDTALTFGLVHLAVCLPLEESQRALALLDEAIEVATRIGDRQGVSSAIWFRALLAARRGDWRTALRAGADAAEQKLELGDLLPANGCLHAAGIALCALGSCEPTAVLFGRADASTAERLRIDWIDWIVELLAATDAALLETLGEQQVATLAEQGAALETADAVAYLRAEADRVLAAS